MVSAQLKAISLLHKNQKTRLDLMHIKPTARTIEPCCEAPTMECQL